MGCHPPASARTVATTTGRLTATSSPASSARSPRVPPASGAAVPPTSSGASSAVVRSPPCPSTSSTAASTCGSLADQRSGSGSGPRARRPGAWWPRQGHVEGPHALGLLVDDGRRLDHHRGVELEALDQADRHQRDPRLEAIAGGTAELDAGRLERGGHLVDLGGRHDDRHVAGVDGVPLGRHRGDPGGQVAGVVHGDDAGLVAGLAHRRRRARSGGGDGQHLGGQVHVRPRDAVADGQLGPLAGTALGRCSRISSQFRCAHTPVAWAMSPTTVIEPLSERRSSMRSCIGDRSCASSTTMCP